LASCPPSSPSNVNDDGSLTFYIQAAQPDLFTESIAYADWRPSPPDGDFVLLLRTYWPGQDAVDADLEGAAS
jgi:hypothetical protein